jgi:endonuclease/exonuclease/phosphatase family metal-dependent hydrolase
MKYYLAIFMLLSITGRAQHLNNLSFGTDTTFDIITWNMEWFPSNGQSTIDSMIVAIEAIDADVIAVQEVDNGLLFQQMIDNLEGYSGYFIDSDYLELGYLYKNGIENFSVDTIYQLFNTPIYNRQFPRRPLAMEIHYNNEFILVINNHLKCCGNGYMDLSDEWDEETRRFDACNLLDQFVSVYHPNDKVIITGDMNDLIQETGASNVFQVFINDSSSYFMMDMEIAEGPVSHWSYPSWPSHLDHFIVSNEFSEEIDNENFRIETLRIEDFLANGFYEYENNMSDHRPLALSFAIDQLSLDLQDLSFAADQVIVYPNPAADVINIGGDQVFDQIRLYSQDGKLLLEEALSTNRIDISNLKAGVYILTLSYQKQLIRKKIIKQ